MRKLLNVLISFMSKEAHSPWSRIVSVIQKLKCAVIAKNKQKIQRRFGNFDPFLEVAKNRLQTAVFVQGGSHLMTIGTYMSLARMMKAHRTLGKTPFCIFIGALYVTPLEQTAGLNIIRRSMIAEQGSLEDILNLRQSVSHQGGDTVIHLSHEPDMSQDSVIENFETTLYILFSFIASIPNSVCLLVAPYQDVWFPSMVKDFEIDIKNLNIHQIHPESFDFVYGKNDVVRNRILFPMYHYTRKGQRIHAAIKAYPFVNPNHITMNFWDYHQVIYDVDGKNGIHFLQKSGIES